MARTTKTNGKRVAHIDETGGEFIVSVWYDNGSVASRWFKSHSTCSNEYKSRKGAEGAADKFLTH